MTISSFSWHSSWIRPPRPPPPSEGGGDGTLLTETELGDHVWSGRRRRHPGGGEGALRLPLPTPPPSPGNGAQSNEAALSDGSSLSSPFLQKKKKRKAPYVRGAAAGGGPPLVALRPKMLGGASCLAAGSTTPLLYRGDSCVPDFMVIGATKAGSTAMWSYISQHPCVSTGTKESHFLTYNYGKGSAWWAETMKCDVNASRDLSTNVLIGDGTPEYLYLPGVAERAFDANPNTRLVAIIRDPISRAFSMFNMARRSKRKGGAAFESAETFMDSVADELACYGVDVSGGWDAAVVPAWSREEAKSLFERCGYRDWEGLVDIVVRNKMAFPLHTGTFLSRSIYVHQLARWREVYGDDALLVVEQQALYRDTQEAMHRVFAHLGLSQGFAVATNDARPARQRGSGVPADDRTASGKDWGYETTAEAGSHHRLPPGVLQILKDFFSIFNRELQETLGESLPLPWGY